MTIKTIQTILCNACEWWTPNPRLKRTAAHRLLQNSSM